MRCLYPKGTKKEPKRNQKGTKKEPKRNTNDPNMAKNEGSYVENEDPSTENDDSSLENKDSSLEKWSCFPTPLARQTFAESWKVLCSYVRRDPQAVDNQSKVGRKSQMNRTSSIHSPVIPTPAEISVNDLREIDPSLARSFTLIFAGAGRYHHSLHRLRCLLRTRLGHLPLWT